MKAVLSFLVLLLASVVAAVSSSGSRLLVLLDDLADKDRYSKFLGDIQSRGFEITYSTPKNEKLALYHLEERLFDHALIFPIKAKSLGPNLTPQILLKFVRENGNILVALSADTTISTSIVSLLKEVGIHLPADRTGLVVDHFNYDAASAAEQHDVLVLGAPKPVRAGIRDFFGPSGDKDAVLVFPRGVGQTLGAGPLLASILRAPRTAYSYNPKEQAETISGGGADEDDDALFGAGEQLSLVSAMQGRHSRRVAVVGSADMLSDKWFDAKVKRAGGKEVATYNREFAQKVSRWAFQELGVIRVNSVRHHLSEEKLVNSSNPTMYRIKNDVTYTISISEYDGKSWGPYTLPAEDDIQLEFTMLSPFHRLALKPAATQPAARDATEYTVSFRVPDQHGIFNFRLNYKRPFLTNVDEKDTVSVRHMAHDEYARSYAISGAWPWMVGIGATVTGWLGFCLIFMFSAPVGKASMAKKTQ